MTATDNLARSAELERLLGSDRLARPQRPLSEGTAGRRDPSPSWDAWFCLPMTTRRQLLPFMAPAGCGGLLPDDMADMIGAGSIDEALERWARVCLMARRGASGWAMGSAELEDWESWDAQRDDDAALYGPAEFAELLGISLQNFHQRLSRTRRGLLEGAAALPAPDLVLSRVSIWTGETIRHWQAELEETAR